MALRFIVLAGALCALRGISATAVNSTLNAKALRSSASQPIMDEAALQEAEINDKEQGREQETSYIEQEVDDEDSDPQEMGYIETGVDDEDPEPKSSEQVHQLQAALDEGKEDQNDADGEEEEVPARRNLRAKPQPASSDSSEASAEKMQKQMLDPSRWASNSSSAASSMEKQLTDLMMSGNAQNLAATPFGKSVKQIERLIKDEMMVKVLNAHKSNQGQLNKEAKAIEECGDTKESQVASANKKKALYLKTSPLHKTCRAGEAGKSTEKTEAHNEMKDKQRIKELKCKEFAMVSKQHGDQQANGQIVKKGGSEQTESYVRRLTSTICGAKFPVVGRGGAGKNGFLDNFLIAKEECEKATKEYNAQVKKYNTVAKEYADKKSECDSLQDQMDNSACKRATEMKDACETYAECYFDRKKAHDATVKMVKTEEKDRKAEWRGLKRMQCLMKAFNDGQVSSSEIKRCKERTHETKHLIIKYPMIPKLVTCSVPKLYPATPEYKLAEFAPLPALAKGKQDANECTGIIEISTQPARGSPRGCKCERVTLNGPYSAGPLVKCTNCLEARRSLDRNSCPDGTKIFSPRSASDWKTIFSSAGELKAPHFIVDVTRPRSGCGSCRSKPMNSAVVGREWQTSDGSPWWLRSTRYAEPNGNYQPNCYLGLKGPWQENSISFDDKGCHFHSTAYYCQNKNLEMEPKKGSPSACKCKQVVLAGSYSPGALIKCTNCLDVSRSMQKNSCPVGTKIFSPANAQDWKTFLASAQPLRSPSWIIDVTRPQNGCGGCQHKPMNSDSPAQSTWRTSDGSKWWLRSSKYTEPNGDYTANCYMDLWKTPFSETNIMFNDAKCKAHSNAYYCQPVKKKKAPVVVAPPPPPRAFPRIRNPRRNPFRRPNPWKKIKRGVRKINPFKRNSGARRRSRRRKRRGFFR